MDPADRHHPDRWHYATPTSPGSRATGLHWAAVWIERRALDEDDAHELFRPPPPELLDEAAESAARCRRRVERALGRDGRATVVDLPCPWCGGELTARTRSGDLMAAVVTCHSGPTCTAPARYDERARRHWKGADLVGLYAALAVPKRRTTTAQ
jgi:hypothetical protein